MLERSQVVILGEQHHRPESTALAGAVAAAFTGEGRCLVVGLEVAFTEQGPVDAVLDGTTTVSAVWLEASRFEALAAGVEGTWRVAMEKPESTGEVVDGIVRWEYR